MRVSITASPHSTQTTDLTDLAGSGSGMETGVTERISLFKGIRSWQEMSSKVSHQAEKVSFVPLILKMNRSGIACSMYMIAFLPVQWQGMT